MAAPAMTRLPPPTYVQSLLASVVLISLSLFLAPFTLFITVVALIWTRLQRTSLAFASSLKSNRGVVLVTGARSNKALTLIRAFKRAGYLVVAAEEEEWGVLAPARFSRAVDIYHLLPNAQHDHDRSKDSAYIDAVKNLVIQHNVSAWIPVSSVHATMQDSEVARQIQQHPRASMRCQSFIQHPDIAGMLHWKDQFDALLAELGYPRPEGRRITTIAQALDFLYADDNGRHAYILKCLTLDDLARDDFTLLPLASREKTTAHLKRMPTPISDDTPFLLQRFLKGPEYCCHVAARNGRITAFVACRSNEMLMRYVDIRTLGEKELRMSETMEHWVQEFLDRWKVKLSEAGSQSYERELTGHFSFDFIWEEEEQVLYALECNVRAHTAVCLMSTATPTLAESYLSEDSPPLSRPPPQSAPVSWITHALPLAILRSFLHLPIVRGLPWTILHPGLLAVISRVDTLDDPTASPQSSDTPLSILIKFTVGTFLPESVTTICRGVVAQTRIIFVEENLVCGTSKGFGRGERDAYWDWTDPLPFFVVAHVTWLWLWTRLTLWRGGKWRRINVSTERIFEC